jgi:hypothetical protein
MIRDLKSTRIFIILHIFAMAPFAAADEPDPILEKTVELLLSPSKRDQREGEILAVRNADAYGDTIVAGLKDSRKRAVAAYQLRVLVSPWARGVAAGLEHKGHMTLFLPRRPVARPLDGPHHPVYRKALLDALNATATGPEVDDREFAFESICQTLTEIGDSASLIAMAQLLKETDDYRLGRLLLESLCRRVGFHHPGTPLGRMCGPLHFAEAKSRNVQNLSAQDRFIRQRNAFLQEFPYREDEAPDQQQLMRRALDRLEKRMLVPEFVRLGYDESVSDVDKLEPLIRLGEPLLPLLRKRQAAERDLSKKGNYEVISAAITGEIDPALMRRLLASDHPDRGLACQITIAAGTRDWTNEIAQLQFREGFDHKEASDALASVLRKEALPHLLKALNFDPDNYTAKYAIMELEKWPE